MKSEPLTKNKLLGTTLAAENSLIKVEDVVSALEYFRRILDSDEPERVKAALKLAFPALEEERT